MESFENPRPSQTDPVRVEPDGKIIIDTLAMTKGHRYPFLYRGKVDAIALIGNDGRVRLRRVFPQTRNPLRWVLNRLREPLLTLPPNKTG